MTEYSEPQSGASGASEGSPANLHNLVLGILAALIVMSLGINLFIYKQMRLARYQLAEQRVAVNRLQYDYQRVTEPLVRKFTARLEAFAAANRDFAPVLEKYRGVIGRYLTSPGASPVTPASGTGSPPVAPAPK